LDGSPEPLPLGTDGVQAVEPEAVEPGVPDVPLGALILFEFSEPRAGVLLRAPEPAVEPVEVFESSEPGAGALLRASEPAVEPIEAFESSEPGAGSLLRAPEPAAEPVQAASETPFDAGGDRPDVLLGSLVIFERTETLWPSGTEFPAEVEQSILSGATPGLTSAIVREWAESLAIVLAIILVFTGYVAQATQVPTGSMKPTILVGDHFFIEKLAFPGNYPAAVRPFLPKRAVRRGDIIVFRSPVDSSTPYVKRVIGTPGDSVEIREKDVFVNGVQLDEPYKIHVDHKVHANDSWTIESDKKRDNYGPQIVPPDKFFVMGDNRDDSNDSRYWGFVGRDAIMGMPLFVYWSYRSESNQGVPLTIKDRLNDYLSTGMHFFSRTRWFRFGTLVQ
jgi:signal peptidase I